MTKIEKALIDIANQGQTNKKIFKGEGFTRSFAGRVKDVAKLRNPLTISLLVTEIDNILEIINPNLLAEIEWLCNLNDAAKLFHNDIIISNRLLGIKNDNEFDTRIFEKVVKERFIIELDGKEVKADTLIQTDFKTLVEMVEIGVRRFSR